MAERTSLNPSQAKEIEEQLFSTLRQQAGRSVPMPLPRSDFWTKVGQLLDTIEMDIHEVYKTVGPSLKMQTMQKRQANIRRTASELARKRMVAMLQHSASMALRTEGLQGQDLAAMDWSRHDPAEREFYANATEQLNKFKQAVNWNAMQRGVAAEGGLGEPKMAAGTTQLDSFVPESGGLTGQGPPTIALEDDSEPLPESETDEEDLLAKAEEFPELAGAQPVSEETPVNDAEVGENHAAAMELAPSKKKEDMDFDAWAAADAESETQVEVVEEEDLEPVQGELLRIRVVQSMDEPIITIDGEITLGAGDVLFLDEMTANYLVDSGVAELATL
ncbi:MAG: hypothetical protein CMB05_000870 [Methanobacteriota archaeon]|nr:MAG: hypothetical protein CMB05_000870 [Euryarchaeota archaeon]